MLYFTVRMVGLAIEGVLVISLFLGILHATGVIAN